MHDWIGEIEAQVRFSSDGLKQWVKSWLCEAPSAPASMASASALAGL